MWNLSSGSAELMSGLIMVLAPLDVEGKEKGREWAYREWKLQHLSYAMMTSFSSSSVLPT